jgi:hypothetical protein
VLEPDEGKLSSPVLRGLGASNGARPLGKLWGSVARITDCLNNWSIPSLSGSGKLLQCHPFRAQFLIMWDFNPKATD